MDSKIFSRIVNIYIEPRKIFSFPGKNTFPNQELFSSKTTFVPVFNLSEVRKKLKDK